MATNSLNPLHHRHHHHQARLGRRNSLESPPPFLKTPATSRRKSLSSNPFSTTTFSLFSTTSSSTSTSSATTSTSQQPLISFDLLQHHLLQKNFREADEETRRLLIALAGEAAQKRGYVFFSEVQFISESDLKAIDRLWTQHSGSRYGYSVQKKVWEKVKRDFTQFFIKVGWMKKLDTEVEQYNYRSFPGEFMWALSDETPEGHLPLTNALRGTQLLNSILCHPAFNDMENEEDDDDVGDRPASSGGEGGLLKGVRDSTTSSKPLSKRVSKPDYSF